MSHLSTTTVIIAIPGGQETREMPLQQALDAIARGEIEPNHWAWSPLHNDWKQVCELPELQLPLVEEKKQEPVPVVPVVKVQTVPVQRNAPVTYARSGKSLVVKEEGGFSFFKAFVILLALGVIGVAGVNYALVDQPLQAKMAQGKFSAVPVHAHLGAFLQPNAIVIHLLPSDQVQATNLADMLVSLAKSTPKQPLNGLAFASVGLTSAWTSQFAISGQDWQLLAKMEDSTTEEKQDFILGRFVYANGQSVLTNTRITDPDALKQRRDKAWQEVFSTLYPR